MSDGDRIDVTSPGCWVITQAGWIEGWLAVRAFLAGKECPPCPPGREQDVITFLAALHGGTMTGLKMATEGLAEPEARRQALGYAEGRVAAGLLGEDDDGRAMFRRPDGTT